MNLLLLLLLVTTVAALPISSSIDALPLRTNSSQNTPAQAVALARHYYDAQLAVTPGLCDHYVGFWYGHSASGWPSAIDQWKGTPADKKLSGWTVGALVFYEGGEYGHVAICAEDSGVIFSTDLPNKGKVQPLPSRLPPIYTDHQVGRVAADAPVKDWGMKLLGYTVAYFPNA